MTIAKAPESTTMDSTPSSSTASYPVVQTYLATLLPLLALVSLLAAPARADKVWLANGNFLEGNARVLENGDVAIETAAGTMTLPAESVRRVERTETMEQQVAEFLRQNPDAGADTLYRLGVESRDAGSTTLARQLFERAVELDPRHAAARRALGYRQGADGEWLTEEEWHAQRGEVYYEGKWIRSEVRDEILRADAERRSADAQVRLELARRAATEAQRQRAEEARTQQSNGIPYWYVWTPSGVPIYPPGYGPRPEHPIAPVPPGLPVVRPPDPPPTPPAQNRSTFRPPG